MLITFGATFFGVIASFLLWFGSQWWIRQKHNKKAVKAMMKEIEEEIQINIALLAQLKEKVPTMLEEGQIPIYIPNRMNLAVYEYVVSTGEIRLLDDIRKQRLIRNAAIACQTFNKFIDNTEALLITFLLRRDGLKWSKYRVEKLIEDADEKRKYLLDILNKLQQDELPNEDTEKRLVETNVSNSERLETRLSKIEKGIRDIKNQLYDNQNTATFYFVFGLGVVAIAIATGISVASPNWGTTYPDLPSVALLILVGGLAIIFASIWQYQGRFRKRLGISGLIITFLGVGLVVATSFFDFAIMPFLKLGGLFAVVIGLYLLIFATKFYRK